ncbi:MAG: class I SAM-dependent methyltransferase [Acidobacteria bacterium]|nr:class I SAM-dependent methyltransferase [Acidobacteriota bacterium]
MNRKALESFACPECRAALRLAHAEPGASSNGRIREGLLECTGCSATFPILRSMPRFVPSEEYAASFGYQWNRFDRLQLDRVMHNDLSRERFYATTGWPARMEGQRILEAGCGMGRFTQIALETGAEVFSFDLSNSIEANFKNNGTAESVHIFQASIYKIPLRPGTFDKIFCMGVLQHCPDVKQAFLSLVPYLRPGGEIVIDVYQRNRFVPALKYWVRPFVTWMGPRKIHALLRVTIPPAFELKKALYQVPVVGKPIGNLIPIGPISHKPKLEYTDEELKEVKMLSALDMLSPVHDHPQNIEDVRAWFAEAGLVDIQMKTGFNGINAKGKQP